MKNLPSQDEWKMHLFTFSYWFIFNKEDLNRLLTISLEGKDLVFYPPYKSSPANQSFTPQPDKALFKDGFKSINSNYTLPKVNMYPFFNEDGIGLLGFQIEEHHKWSSNRKLRKDMPADTIRIDTQADDELVSAKILQLIEIIRVASNQWWMGREAYSDGYISVKQIIDSNGQSTKEPPTVSSQMLYVNPFFSKAKVVNWSMWLDCINKLENGYTPPIYKSFLLDSIHNLAKSDSTRTILDIARTLDIAVDINFKRIWKQNKMGTPGNYSRKAFTKNIHPLPGSGFNSTTLIPLLISHITQSLLNRSFQAENTNSFIILDEFWSNKRNPVSHGAILTVSTADLSKYITAASECIDWLETL